ncbi:hypothetical protein LINGRAPRIM_LOCUS2063 [Linum grandiflorum]
MGRVVAKNTFYAKLDNSQSNLCPRIANRLERSKFATGNVTVEPTLDDTFEYSVGDNRYVVKLGAKTCTCGYWELSGIPCLHVVAAVSFMRYDLSCNVHECYTVAFARKAYEVGIPALSGPEAWLNAEGLQVHPPISRTVPGRPKKLRARELIELETVPSKDGVGTMVRKKGMDTTRGSVRNPQQGLR